MVLPGYRKATFFCVRFIYANFFLRDNGPSWICVQVQCTVYTSTSMAYWTYMLSPSIKYPWYQWYTVPNRWHDISNHPVDLDLSTTIPI